MHRRGLLKLRAECKGWILNCAAHIGVEQSERYGVAVDLAHEAFAQIAKSRGDPRRLQHDAEVPAGRDSIHFSRFRIQKQRGASGPQGDAAVRLLIPITLGR